MSFNSIVIRWKTQSALYFHREKKIISDYSSTIVHETYKNSNWYLTLIEKKNITASGYTTMPETLPTFPNFSCPILTHLILHMVQHVADWVTLFLRSQHSPPTPPLKHFQTSIPSLLLPPLTCTKVRANHHKCLLESLWEYIYIRYVHVYMFLYIFMHTYIRIYIYVQYILAAL